MTATVDNYEVVGSAKIGGAPMVLRRFGTEDEAITHCLGVKMDYWHDVWVRKVQITPKREVLGPPKFPWTVLWQGSYAYIVDAEAFHWRGL